VREAADGRGGRNAGELAGRPTNACARERYRGAGGGKGGAWARVEAVDGGSHRRARRDDDGGRGGAAR
jgi:hypothetical protein